MRLAVGVPVGQIAKKMGFSGKMVFHMERREQDRKISLEWL
jgi:hypothetical protein